MFQINQRSRMAGPARMANREGEDKVAGADAASDAGEEGDDDEDEDVW